MKDNFTVYDLLIHSKNVYDVDFRDNEGVILDRMDIAKAIASKYSSMSVIEFMPFLLCNGSIKLIIYV